MIPADERSSEPGRGPWFLSVMGRQVYPFSLRPDEVHVEEVAYSLSMLCRFNGHTRSFYSVAQHSVIVAENLPPDLQFLGLMHDGTEAYCGDLIRPIKRAIPGFARLEDRIWLAIAGRFALPEAIPPAVKLADTRALQTERRDLLAPHPWPWMTDQIEDGTVLPFPEKIVPWPPEVARRAFLDRFQLYAGERGDLHP